MQMAIKKGIVVILGVFFQIIFSLFIYLFLIENFAIIQIFYSIIGFLLVLALVRNSRSYSYTLPWIIILILVPLLGTILYLIIGKNKLRSKTLKRIVKSTEESQKYLIQDEKIREEFQENGKIKYISDYTGFPVTKNNDVSYYPLGEEAFEAMLEELKKAEKFIFFEYFIVAPGKMWSSILDILKEKAQNGLDVRVMYDDFGCVATLPNFYPQELEKFGIKCVVFNKLNPIAGVFMNNRDHRKILVIDGKVAFSGGINIADEYINVNSKYGHWKDNGFKVSGDAVWNYTVMFLTMWSAFRKEDEDFTKFKFDFKDKQKENGFVVPYGETPLDDEITGEDVYLNIINQANKYVYIFTPYLIIDTDMINSLNLAAKRGVDVRIVIPGIPDKKIVYTVSESYLETLVKSGVKIYKYTPGFVHSKVFVSDDHVATCGTINMDYRSLYLHFECGCYFEDVDVIQDIKKDLDETIKKSHEVTKEEALPKLLKGTWQALLRLVAPLM
ncbi:MAG: cardiolipin synthase [Clostridia bacterium]|nr:cardiolipin synthase [Clostridia bacterium]